MREKLPRRLSFGGLERTLQDIRFYRDPDGHIHLIKPRDGTLWAFSQSNWGVQCSQINSQVLSPLDQATLHSKVFLFLRGSSVRTYNLPRDVMGRFDVEDNWLSGTSILCDHHVEMTPFQDFQDFTDWFQMAGSFRRNIHALLMSDGAISRVDTNGSLTLLNLRNNCTLETSTGLIFLGPSEVELDWQEFPIKVMSKGFTVSFERDPLVVFPSIHISPRIP